MIKMMIIKLRKHQEEGIKFIEEGKHLGSLLMHGMGLGKTLSALTFARHHLARLRAQGVSNAKFMVVIPKSASTTWQVECQTHMRDIYRDMVLIPYSQLNKAPKLIQYYDFRLIIMDESHYCKSPDTGRIKNLAAMFSHLDTSKGGFKHGKVVMLTGTPIPNSAAEFYTSWAVLASPNAAEASIRLLDETRYEKWTRTFAQQKEKKWKEKDREKKGTYFEGVQNVEMLQELLNPIVHFRRVEDCIDLPEKQESFIDLNLPDDKLLKDANIEEPEAYMALLESLARAKTPHMINWVDDFMHTTKDQLVVFSMYRFPIQELQEKYASQMVLVTGEQTGGERKANIEAFQSKKKRIIGLTYKAGAESLNLQNAHTTLYLGFPWHDAAIKQAMARTYRSGQKNFTLHYFMMSGYNDMRILNLVRAKGATTKEVEDALLKSSKEENNDLDLYL